MLSAVCFGTVRGTRPAAWLQGSSPGRSCEERPTRLRMRSSAQLHKWPKKTKSAPTNDTAINSMMESFPVNCETEAYSPAIADR
jgi:hypothetical protein